MRRRVLFLVLIVLCLAPSITAQAFSDRQEVAIFRLSYYGQPAYAPSADVRVEVRGRRGSVAVELSGTGNPVYDDLFARALGAVDEQIRGVFVNLGRFRVIGMEQRLTEASVEDFIAVLSDYKLGHAEIPEAVLLGRQAFTERDFRRLAGGFVVVVPSVSWFDLRHERDGRYAAQMQTSFAFIDVQNMRTFAQFFIETSRYDDTPERAVKGAVDALPAELSFRIRMLPEFQLRTGILDVTRTDVILEFGRNMGLQPGDEYAIVAERVLPTGHVTTTETGLILVREVHQEVSYARVIYARPKAKPGDQLREVPRRGFETQMYYDVFTDGIYLTPLLGLKVTASRGFYDWRPFAAFEIPFRGVIGTTRDPLFPMNVVLGGEWNAYLGRLRLSPSVSAGLGGVVPFRSDDHRESFYLSHVGGAFRLTGSLLLGRNVRASVQTGVGYWLSVFDESAAWRTPALASYGGLVIGAGLSLK